MITPEMADLWFPDRQDPIGRYPAGNRLSPAWPKGADRLRYIKWIDTGRPYSAITGPEFAPRIALHLIRCRNGAGT